jgi:lipopolysaccharide/colanic/teichoic acid biosynthesis glycosyltransferase
MDLARTTERHAWKRICDIIFGGVILIFLVPVLLIIGLLIKITSLGPMLFLQQRVGLAGKPFMIIKFRTMIPDAIEHGLGLRTRLDDPRITPLGKFLREFHLDELPQLLNVLRGDMSLVGPRPTVPSQVDTYTTFQMRRLEVRPGITGLAQVSGNNELSWEKRIELDVFYVDNLSFWLDLKILLKTIDTVVMRKGVYGKDGMVHDKEKSLVR